jgi:hypothetical protein
MKARSAWPSAFLVVFLGCGSGTIGAGDNSNGDNSNGTGSGSGNGGAREQRHRQRLWAARTRAASTRMTAGMLLSTDGSVAYSDGFPAVQPHRCG